MRSSSKSRSILVRVVAFSMYCDWRAMNIVSTLWIEYASAIKTSALQQSIADIWSRCPLVVVDL